MDSVRPSPTAEHFHVYVNGRMIQTYTDWDKANDHVEGMRVGPEDPRWRRSDPWIGYYVTVCANDCLGPEVRNG